MSTISSTLKMFDAMTGPLKNITNSMNMLISTMHQMQNMTNQNINIDKTLVAAKKQLVLAESGIKQAISQSANEQQKFNQRLEEGTSKSNRLLASVKSFVATYVSFLGFRSFAQMSDEYINTLSRLDMINDGLQTTVELQNKIFAAAERSRGQYTDMAGVIGRMGILAREAFSGNDELIAFTELMQKSFRVGGASVMEQQAAMYQLSQAMAAGRLQGDEFRSIMENAPMLADAIARYMGKTKGELKELSADGVITADIIKNAMFAAADDINAKFESMPRTFGDIWNQITNTALQRFGPTIERINQLLNSDAGVRFANGISNGIAVAATMVNLLVDGVAWLITTISNGWSVIQPILLALATVYLANIIKQLWAMIPPLYGQAVAWLAVHWPILLVIGAIAMLIYILGQLGVKAEYVIGFVGGLFNSLFAFIWNQVAVVWDLLVSFAEFMNNVFIDPVYAIKKLFYDLFKTVMDYFGNFANTLVKGLNWIIEQINSVTGASLGLIPEYSSAILERYAPKSTKNVVDFSAYKMGQRDLAESFKTGFKYGEGVVGKINGLFNPMTNMKPYSLEMPSMGNIGNIDKVGEVGKIKDTVDISSEDLKLMRELAEMRNIQNFVTLTPTVSVQTGDINNGYDIDTVINRITDALETQIASSVQGVYRV